MKKVVSLKSQFDGKGKHSSVTIPPPPPSTPDGMEQFPKGNQRNVLTVQRNLKL